jgi:hypothetical protein
MDCHNRRGYAVDISPGIRCRRERHVAYSARKKSRWMAVSSGGIR